MLRRYRTIEPTPVAFNDFTHPIRRLARLSGVLGGRVLHASKRIATCFLMFNH